RLHRPVHDGGNCRRSHEPLDFRRTGGGEFSPAARHQILADRTVQPVDRVPLKVNEVGETGDGNTSPPRSLRTRSVWQLWRRAGKHANVGGPLVRSPDRGTGRAWKCTG